MHRELPSPAPRFRDPRHPAGARRALVGAALGACLAGPALGADGAGVLHVGGAIARPASLSLADLEALGPVTATWTAGGERRRVLGVPLDRLLARYGLETGRMGDGPGEGGKGWRRVVIASAPDGFQAALTVAEIAPHMGATRALVAWKIDGKPLPPDRGPLRLVVLTDKVASRSVYALSRLEVVALGADGAAAAHAASPHGAAAARTHAPHPPAAPPDPAPPASSEALARVAAIHGAAGPFAVAGYRMGQRAMRELGLPPGSPDLEVRHESPAQVQWSCIADGAQAATGASAGKLTLRLREAPREATRTVFRRRSTGAVVAFRLKPSFVKRFVDVPPPELARAGADAMALGDDEIFTVERP
jgi:DMSO/TMAO reductase YedYZ molybdopterin-dependent catalytic subunit